MHIFILLLIFMLVSLGAFSLNLFISGNFNFYKPMMHMSAWCSLWVFKVAIALHFSNVTISRYCSCISSIFIFIVWSIGSLSRQINTSLEDFDYFCCRSVCVSKSYSKDVVCTVAAVFESL